MSKFFAKLSKGKKGMEALQAVILVGLGFLILWGVQSAYKDNEKDFQNATKDLMTGNAKGTTGGDGKPAK